MKPIEPRIATPMCPRCGYELHGMVAAWQHSCPLAGRCSECGLDFAWREVLNPRFNVPKWCMEYGSAWSVPARLARTLLMMLRPRRFWSELQMTHQPHWLRLAIVALLPGLLLYAVFALSVGRATYDWVRTNRVSGGLPPTGDVTDALLATAWPWGRMHERRYSTIPLDIARRYDFAPTAAAWHAIVVGVERGVPPESPFVISERAATAVIVLLLCPLSLALLPLSRRMAKVRWRHIVRIAIYSLAFATLPLGVDCWNQVAGVGRLHQGYVALGITIGTSLLLWLWWSIATARYLRMPHAWAVGLLIVGFAHVLQTLTFEAISAIRAVT